MTKSRFWNHFLDVSYLFVFNFFVFKCRAELHFIINKKENSFNSLHFKFQYI